MASYYFVGGVSNNPNPVTIYDDVTGVAQHVGFFGDSHTTERVPLVGQTPSSPLDTNIWTNTVTGSGALTSAGAFVLSTGATANSTDKLYSVQRAFMQAGQINTYYANWALGDTGATGNSRRWGAFDANVGYYFELQGTTLGIGYRISGVDTFVSTLNGIGPLTKDTNGHLYTIEYAQGGARFYQDNRLVHTLFAVLLLPSIHLTLGNENINSGGHATNHTMTCTGMVICREGPEGQATYLHLNTNVTTVIKQTPGKLSRVIINKGTGNAGTLTLYDNTAGSGSLIAVIDITNVAVATSIEYGLVFNTGLTAVQTGSAGTPADLTLVYY